MKLTTEPDKHVILPERAPALLVVGQQIIDSLKPLTPIERIYVLSELLGMTKESAGVGEVTINYYNAGKEATA